jgi:hypothetical protein
MGQFLVPVEQLDVDCQPTTRFVDTLLQGGVLTGSASTFDIVAQAVGSVESNDDVVRATLAPDLSSLQGQLGGVASTCTLTILGSPIGSGSMLDLIVNNFVVEPDIDVDHNGGLDRVIGDGSRVTECIAADGTHIPGNVCGCDPRMHDGYSLAISFTAVPAQIVGIAGTP